MIFRSPLRPTGQPGRHECGTSLRESLPIAAVNFGGPEGVGAGGAGVLATGGVAAGETNQSGDDTDAPGDAADASTGNTAGVAGGADWGDIASFVPPQAVRLSRATNTTADLGFHLEAIRAEYPRRANVTVLSVTAVVTALLGSTVVASS
ncbi:hypothetical protein N5079_15925 [Planotetraspora sp. A-T 1434]|uniref:hypothetical protein n=1 Tax=Planotetraspora sp. A-T 1434 TaxID=2979219 RepID=UPI0021C187C1|nr:hypothetical protein [Planotetraspora sp. A-T 1434]MCT9931701.1 hypothetical protein [Planotetraspora sp. A-T 1434]